MPHTTVTGGDGATLRLIKNGEVLTEVAIAGDPFAYEVEIEAPMAGADRYRQEVANGATLLAVTSYVWLQRESEDDDGCAVSTPDRVLARSGLLLIGLLGIVGMRHLARRQRTMT